MLNYACACLCACLFTFVLSPYFATIKLQHYASIQRIFPLPTCYTLHSTSVCRIQNNQQRTHSNRIAAYIERERFRNVLRTQSCCTSYEQSSTRVYHASLANDDDDDHERRAVLRCGAAARRAAAPATRVTSRARVIANAAAERAHLQHARTQSRHSRAPKVGWWCCCALLLPLSAASRRARLV